MQNSLEQVLENTPNVGYIWLSHLINLRRLVGYLVSGIIVVVHFDATLT